ncbi:MAG: hypothetical protein BGO43_14710 [Gammaproteobacteria bacterium 39-13]|nr:tetratricopeptide repeat protein [Gammaproteobacteria bacterium]OJV88843.1 MAG: hypothetical protein BGO43_14710 [Gammaproteobacteria bacterium 39-13]
MDAYVTEEQQVEDLKKWFKKYGGILSWVVIIICLVASVFMYWQHHQQVIREQASEQYMALLESIEKEDKTTANAKADILLNRYASSPYAALASLVLASDAVQANDFKQAELHLNWVITNGKQIDFQRIAKIRLMRLFISQNKLDEAMQLYSDKKAGGFLTLMAELKGDILLKQKDIPGAKKAYELAYSSAPEEGMHGPLLKMKMEELGIKIPDAKNEEKAVEKEAAVS